MALAGAGIVPRSLSAQASDVIQAPSAEQCAEAVASLGGATPPAPARPAWWTATRCGVAGGAALASAFRQLQTESAAAPLRAAEAVLRTIRDASVFSAALAVSTASGATPGARMLGVRVLLSQHSTAVLITQSLPCRRITVVGTPTAPGAALPADYPRQALVALRSIAADAAAPAELRSLASCAAESFASVVDSPAASSSIRLTYLCGNRFRVRNTGDEWGDLTYDVYRTDDRGDLTVGPRSEVVFTTEVSGTTRLFVNPNHDQPLGQLVQTKANGGTACR